MKNLPKNKMENLVIHNTLTPYSRIVTPDDLFLWHCGALRLKDGTARFMGETILQGYLKYRYLTLPSGKTISADKTNGRGWRVPGYADMINQDGSLVNVMPYTFDETIDSFEVTNGASGYNKNSRHVVLVGGWSKDGKIRNGYKKPGILFEPDELFTEPALNKLIEYIEMQKVIVTNVKIYGHNELASKPCPNFDVQKFLTNHGLK